MRDEELYQQILGLHSPWSVDQGELDQEASEINVNVEHPRGTKFCCPECDRELPCHDHTEPRRSRCLDSCQLKTFLVARAPRVNRPCGGGKKYKQCCLRFEN